MNAQTRITFSLHRAAFAGVSQSVEGMVSTLEDSPLLIVIPPPPPGIHALCNLLFLSVGWTN